MSIIVLVALAIVGFVTWRKVRENGARRALRWTVGEVGSGPVECPRRDRRVSAPLVAAPRWCPLVSAACESSQKQEKCRVRSDPGARVAGAVLASLRGAVASEAVRSPLPNGAGEAVPDTRHPTVRR